MNGRPKRQKKRCPRNGTEQQIHYCAAIDLGSTKLSFASQNASRSPAVPRGTVDFIQQSRHGVNRMKRLLEPQKEVGKLKSLSLSGKHSFLVFF